MSAAATGHLVVSADRGACCQAGRCADALPEVFDNDDAGYVVVVQEVVALDRREDLEECVDLCPSGALGFRVVQEPRP